MPRQSCLCIYCYFVDPVSGPVRGIRQRAQEVGVFTPKPQPGRSISVDTHVHDTFKVDFERRLGNSLSAAVEMAPVKVIQQGIIKPLL